MRGGLTPLRELHAQLRRELLAAAIAADPHGPFRLAIYRVWWPCGAFRLGENAPRSAFIYNLLSFWDYPRANITQP
eukprot:4908832-Heterocapsa_arctica.AAC.1